MAKNVFLYSMYFIIPLNDVEHIDKYVFKKKEYGENFQNMKCELSYAEIELQIPAIANYVNDNNGSNISREYKLNTYLIRYRDNSLKTHIDNKFLAVGTSIDKLFDKNKKATDDNLLGPDDIIKIRQSIMSHNACVNGLKVKDWIKKLCENEEYCFIACDEDYFKYSIIDISTVKADFTPNVSYSELTGIFESSFFSDQNENYNKVFEHCDKFAYGLLKADCQYGTFTNNVIHPFLKNSYYIKNFERLFANNMGTVFVRTHCPFNNPDHTPCIMSNNINDVFNIIEIVSLINAKQTINNYKRNKKYKDSEELNNASIMIGQLLSDAPMGLEEADRKISLLRDCMSIYEDGERAKKHIDNLCKTMQSDENQKLRRRNEIKGSIALIASVIATIGGYKITNDMFTGLIILLVSLSLIAYLTAVFTYKNSEFFKQK